MVLAVMFGWLLVIVGASSVVARNDPNIEVPIPIARGVVVMPADGWYSAEEEWDVGENGIALQKSGVYVAFWVEEYHGTNDELMAGVLNGLSPYFDSFQRLPAQPIIMAGRLEGLMVRFSGITEWGYEENMLAVLSHEGTSVVMLAEAAAGQLHWVQGDIDRMLRTIEIPQ